MSKLMNQDEVMEHLRGGTPLNHVRAMFSGWMGRIEQEGAQRTRPTIFEVRAMEFQAVEEIIAEAKRVGLCR